MGSKWLIDSIALQKKIKMAKVIALISALSMFLCLKSATLKKVKTGKIEHLKSGWAQLGLAEANLGTFLGRLEGDL
jgi:hypothetical protein